MKKYKVADDVYERRVQIKLSCRLGYIACIRDMVQSLVVHQQFTYTAFKKIANRLWQDSFLIAQANDNTALGLDRLVNLQI